MAKPTKNQTQNSGKKVIKNPRSIYALFLILVTFVTSINLVFNVISDLATKTNPNGTCGYGSVGNITYTPPTYHHPQRDIVFSLLLIAIILLIIGLYKFKGRVYKTVVLVTIVAIGVGAFIFMLQDALGSSLGGIGCIPF